MTQRAAGSFAISNQGPEPLVISAVDCPDEALALVTPRPSPVAPWSGAELRLSSAPTPAARHRPHDHPLQRPRDPPLPVDVDMERSAPNELALSAERGRRRRRSHLRREASTTTTPSRVCNSTSLPTPRSPAPSPPPPSARAKGFSISVEHVAPGRARILAYTLGTPIAPGSGEVMTLTLVPDTPTEEGTYSLTASDIIIGDAAMANVHSATVVPQTDVRRFFLLGDLNADRKSERRRPQHYDAQRFSTDLESIKNEAFRYQQGRQYLTRRPQPSL